MNNTIVHPTYSKPDLSFLNRSTPPLSNTTLRPRLFEKYDDAIISLVAPVVAYWAYSLYFHIIDMNKLYEQYRIHPSEEVAKRNKVGRLEVFLEVLWQHTIQTVFGLILYHYEELPKTGMENYNMWRFKTMFVPKELCNSELINKVIYYGYTYYAFSFLKIFVGFLLIDTWQYWLHRLMHTSKTLYKLFHSRHHRLYVPYAYGALYNNPVEGFLLDTLGTGIAMIVTKLSPREQIILFTFATLKTVDDHCGYALPYDPFQWLFPNNAVYHDIHHQPWGIKSNFAQPFFIFWDKLTKTEYKGYVEYRLQQRRVTIDKYKEFLAKREQERLSRIEDMKKKAI
ncbi:probable Sphingolipid C4-hydroxylase SUR2 [Saccharomycodes ludwigii]|uniref:Probable Sphingolipid C4-hydroxylase SUR2 n=1 Tax=Saccharomycodes ludwigii TaxID=36035 RepID=A0A376B3U8_9ASCO|nr:hypothetical protein SCDLUD_004618 [Saccharomycodes ludwigii]KAH3899188.1 hypothetical protein SCDLUD_004618 [Saccharomycodes ludwigii]SSD59358.1 probable Sphingolipid C4-hydroxylase SUR2 [Saccharomycodes ludwigii]